MNGALNGERLVAMCSPSARMSWIVIALSRICVFVISGVDLVDDVI